MEVSLYNIKRILQECVANCSTRCTSIATVQNLWHGTCQYSSFQRFVDIRKHNSYVKCKSHQWILYVEEFEKFFAQRQEYEEFIEYIRNCLLEHDTIATSLYFVAEMSGEVNFNLVSPCEWTTIHHDCHTQFMAFKEIIQYERFTSRPGWMVYLDYMCRTYPKSMNDVVVRCKIMNLECDIAVVYASLTMDPKESWAYFKSTRNL